MAQRDARPPFAAIDGAVPPEFSALPTPCYLLDEVALTRNAKILGGLARRTGCKVLLAQKAFSKLCPNEQLLAEILAALDWQKQSPDWLKNGGQFVPYASSYLNGRRWEDEPPQNDAPARSDTPKLRWSTNENGEREAVYDE